MDNGFLAHRALAPLSPVFLGEPITLSHEAARHFVFNKFLFADRHGNGRAELFDGAFLRAQTPVSGSFI